MKICYVDESGDDGDLLSPTINIQPVLTIAGIVVDCDNLRDLTLDFLALKTRFFPKVGRSSRHLDRILTEIKGSELRKKAASGDRRERRHSFGVLDRAIDLMERNGVRIIGRVWVKGIGTPFDGRATYTYSIQSLFKMFQAYLEQEADFGVFIADSRSVRGNTQVSHSIFTQKFKQSGDDYARVVDMPTFAHSHNHAGLQISDWLCSALLTPMAIETYCTGYVRNVHVRPGYRNLKARYAPRLLPLQFRYQETPETWRGGITVSDGLAHRSGGMMFGP